MILINFDSIKIERKFVNDVLRNRQQNVLIMGYFSQSVFKYPHVEDYWIRRLERIADCNRDWIMDRYDKSKILDFKRTNLCRDKFCSNCKKVKQASRMGKFSPIIEPFNDRLYQMVLTVPNVSGNALNGTIKEMGECYYRLLQFIKGSKKIRGIDFSHLGYLGAVRSLEVTYHDDSYHPHYHTLIVLENPPGPKVNLNVFSQDFLGKRKKRYFSNIEILIQKIWKLLITGVKVTKSNIESLDLGYSCMLDKSKPEDFQEIFKYMIKTETEKSGQMMTFQNFENLDTILHGVRQIQGYGVFFNVKDDDIWSKQVDAQYDLKLAELKEIENPKILVSPPFDLIKLMKKDIDFDTQKEKTTGAAERSVVEKKNLKLYTIISRKRVFKYLRELIEEGK